MTKLDLIQKLSHWLLIDSYLPIVMFTLDLLRLLLFPEKNFFDRSRFHRRDRELFQTLECFCHKKDLQIFETATKVITVLPGKSSIFTSWTKEVTLTLDIQINNVINLTVAEQIEISQKCSNGK